MEYEDDYTACSRTYSTLRIFPKELHPSSVSKRLQIEPTHISLKGGGHRGQNVNGWFLSSEDHVESNDSRRHIDWILDQIESATEAIAELQANGSTMDISCFWVSTSGNGGPTISPQQMERLVRHNLEVWWDVYFSGNDE